MSTLKAQKKTLGQFFTTNYKYILQNMKIPKNIETIIEPFTGNGDLLNFLDLSQHYVLECYDIDSKKDFILEQDTIKNPPDYTNKFILTNPPYLARNKSKDKSMFDKYKVNDLYKCFLKEIIINKALGGIIIIPLNFWSSIRKADIDLRKEFLKVYSVVHLNIFEEQVFEDTTITVCSFQFKLKQKKDSDFLKITVYPSGTDIKTELNNKNNYMIGGEIYSLKNKNYTITRITNKNKDQANTNILVKCIDDNSNNKIGLKMVSDSEVYIDTTPNSSARTYASLIIIPELTKKEQEKLVFRFNTFLESKREQYHSLFLTNYRESKDIARKRISFELVYNIIGYLLGET